MADELRGRRQALSRSDPLDVVLGSRQDLPLVLERFDGLRELIFQTPDITYLGGDIKGLARLRKLDISLCYDLDGDDFASKTLAVIFKQEYIRLQEIALPKHLTDKTARFTRLLRKELGTAKHVLFV